MSSWRNIHYELLLTIGWSFLGGLAPAYQLLGWLMFLDMIVATLAAIYHDRFSMHESMKGLIIKIVMVCVVIALEVASGHYVGPDLPAGRSVACLLNVHELCSILRHASTLGDWMPGPVLAFMRRMQQSEDDAKKEAEAASHR